MPKLTRSRIAQITEVLDGSLFTSSAFSVTTGEKGSQIIEVIYRDDAKYYARLFYGKKTAKSLHDSLALANFNQEVMIASFCPGDFLEQESIEDIQFEVFLRRLTDWTERLRSEIVLVDAFQKSLSESYLIWLWHLHHYPRRLGIEPPPVSFSRLA